MMNFDGQAELGAIVKIRGKLSRLSLSLPELWIGNKE
jgi:hypothetical protein